MPKVSYTGSIPICGIIEVPDDILSGADEDGESVAKWIEENALFPENIQFDGDTEVEFFDVKN